MGLTIKAVFAVSIASLLILALSPATCYNQLMAAIHPPTTPENKEFIFNGYLSYLIFNAIYLSVLPGIFIGRRRFWQRFSVTFIPIISLISALAYGYRELLFKQTSYFIGNYSYITDVSLYAILAIGIYLGIFAVPYSYLADVDIAARAKKAILLGLPATIISNIVRFVVVFWSSLFPIYIFRCSAESYGIDLTDINIFILEDVNSLYLGEIIALLLAVLIYVLIVKHLGKRFVMEASRKARSSI